MIRHGAYVGITQRLTFNQEINLDFVSTTWLLIHLTNCALQSKFLRCMETQTVGTNGLSMR